MAVSTFSFSLITMSVFCEGLILLNRKDAISNDNRNVFKVIQYTRKGLKRMRKWKTAHKAEVALAKCVTSYFKYRIPGLERRQDEQFVECSYVDNEYQSDSSITKHRRQRRHQYPSELNYKSRNGNVLSWGLKSKERWSGNRLANLSGSDSHFASAARQTDTEINTHWVLQIRDALASLWHFISQQIYDPFLMPLWEHELFSCSKDYVVSKFWTWVDAAPE